MGITWILITFLCSLINWLGVVCFFWGSFIVLIDRSMPGKRNLVAHLYIVIFSLATAFLGITLMGFVLLYCVYKTIDSWELK